MPRPGLNRHTLLALAATCAFALPPATLAHYDDDEPLQSYRQSYFALVAANFGPLAAMVKGEMPWDIDKVQALSGDLTALSTLDLMRGFAPGSEQGTTRARPEIWDNMDDFETKLAQLREAVDELGSSAASGERSAISASVASVGEACKACHDDYKAKNYLY